MLISWDNLIDNLLEVLKRTHTNSEKRFTIYKTQPMSRLRHIEINQSDSSDTISDA